MRCPNCGKDTFSIRTSDLQPARWYEIARNSDIVGLFTGQTDESILYSRRRIGYCRSCGYKTELP